MADGYNGKWQKMIAIDFVNWALGEAKSHGCGSVFMYVKNPDNEAEPCGIAVLRGIELQAFLDFTAWRKQLADEEDKALAAATKGGPKC